MVIMAGLFAYRFLDKLLKPKDKRKPDFLLTKQKYAAKALREQKKLEEAAKLAELESKFVLCETCTRAASHPAVYRLLYSAGKVVGKLGIGGLFGG
ncbi:hypothetical protein T492DRAFT_867857 [Pavlovales sp. CCMP2436]|nr:hypothetical protein T492DRAFT_867857 [Pavlovales sp. CCMP2436]